MALPMDALLAAVRSSLESRGVLAKMRADLRLAVFTAIDEKEKALGVHLESIAAALFKGDAELRLAAALVADLCDRCGLRGTRSCLAAETGLVRRCPALRRSAKDAMGNQSGEPVVEWGQA